MVEHLIFNFEPRLGIELELGENYQSILEKTREQGLDAIHQKSDVQRKYLNFASTGVSFSFNNNELSSIFLYMKSDNYATFRGGFSFLNRRFWANPTPNKFTDLAQSADFIKWGREYPFSLDVVNNLESPSARFRLTARLNESYIIYDNGSLLRK